MLLENLLRTEDGADITADDIKALAGWDADAEPDKEIQFTPARVIMQDFTGVPCVVDLATMREAMDELGGDASRINPLAPAEMVIDHSVIADVFGSADAFERNVEIEYERNRERYQFLRWGQGAFDDFKVVPPGTGIVHQVNIEHLARVVFTRDADGAAVAYPDTCVGTDSHTTMVNGIGVVGWGVGGIEAEAAMLGQPVAMLIPRVVGFKLSGDLPEGSTATDLVLTITEMLRKHGVVGKFVEFYGPGVSVLPLANRATIGNMSPEFGSTIAVFPIDEETIKYLELTGRPGRAARPGRGLRQGAGPLARPGRRAALLREARARPRHRRPEPGRPQAPAGPGLGHRGRRGEFAKALADYTEDKDATVDRQPRRPGGRDRPRRGHDRRDHVLHQHLQPERDDRRRAARQERRRQGPGPQAVGQDHAGARVEGGQRLLRAVRPHAVPRQARLQPRRLRLHHLHRQLRPAHPRGQPRPSTRPTSPSPACCPATATSRAGSTPT